MNTFKAIYWRALGRGVFLLSMPLASAIASPAQTLQNGSLEGAYTAASGSATAAVSGLVTPSWTDNTTWASGVNLSYERDASTVHGGSASQKITVNSGFAQFLTWSASTQTFSVWLKAQSPMWVDVTLRQADAPYTNYAGHAVRLTPTWTQVSLSGQTPAVGGVILIKTAGTGTLWVDDAALTQSAHGLAQMLRPPSATPIPPTYFGLNANHLHDSPGYSWPAVPFGAFRNWDSGVIWSTIETARGVYNWADLDKDVAGAQAKGQKYLFNFAGIPRWAAPSGPQTYVGTSAAPDDLQDLRDFVRAIATRYKGRIEAYEVWNEPDLNDFYSGTPAQLAAVELTIKEELRAADPKALLVAPPLAGADNAGSLSFLEAYLVAGGGKNCDVFAYHSYDPPETQPDSTRAVHNLLATYGFGGKPVWVTERGLIRGTLPASEGASFVGRSYLLGWATGVRRQYWYAYDNETYSGLDQQSADGKTRDPAQLGADGVAYEQIQKWLVGAKMLSCGVDNNSTWTCVVQDGAGNKGYIVWSTQGRADFSVPTIWKATTYRDLAGNAAPVTRNSIAIGPSPIELLPTKVVVRTKVTRRKEKQ